MAIIEVNNVTKEFKLGQMKSLKQKFLATAGRLAGKKIKKPQPFKALDTVSFTVEPGEVVGIIGMNGAGKSTLLKLLARISVPSRGSIEVRGSVAPLIEVGAGLHHELTGRENIYLNAAILGIKRSEIKKRFDEIVEFAELWEFIDTPLKRYSSGMAVRLGFAIATSVDADILIVDEVLAVGDLAFQRKCYDRMESMIKKQGKTVLIVGHNIRQMERICSRMLLLDKGQIMMDGDPTSVCNAYYHNVTNKKVNEQRELTSKNIVAQADTGEIDVLDISLYNGDATVSTNILEMHGNIRIGVRFEAHIDLPSTEVIIGIHTPDFVYVNIWSSTTQFKNLDFKRGVHYFECRLADMMLKPSSYALRLAFLDKFNRSIWYGQNLRSFRVSATDANLIEFTKTGGLVNLPFKWHFFDDMEK